MKKAKDPKTHLEELVEIALTILKKKKDIYFFCDLATEMGYSYQWLYEIGLDKVEAVKTALLENKKQVKRGLRNKWFNNDNATTQVALYKLLADDDELSRLNNNMDVSLNAKGLNVVVADKKTAEAIEDL